MNKYSKKTLVPGQDPDQRYALNLEELNSLSGSSVRARRRIKFNPKVLAIIGLLLVAGNAHANGLTLDGNDLRTYIVLGLICTIALLVLFVAFYLLHILKVIVRDVAIQRAKEKGEEYVEAPSFWKKLNQSLTQAVPIEQESAIVLDHDYDGIRELDNHLPPWWTYLFYITIAFSVVYMFIYHVSGSMPLQAEEYQAEMTLAAKAKADRTTGEVSNIDENNVELTTDATNLANGAQTYIRQCAACHKEKGEGGIGPNLTDEYWLHGGSISDIFRTIKYGVPDKGMISWEPLLSPTQMRDVTSYIYTLRGTNPPNAKGPQGALYKEEPMAASDSLNVD